MNIKISRESKEEQRSSNEVDQQIFYSIIKDELPTIFELRASYKLLVSIVEIFMVSSPRVDDKLNDYYLHLANLASQTKDSIYRTIYAYYQNLPDDEKSNLLNNVFDIFAIEDSFYLPFSNFYKAQDTINDVGVFSWDEVRNKMYSYLGYLDNILVDHEKIKCTNKEKEKLFNEVQEYILNTSDNSKNKLSINRESGYVSYSSKSNNSYSANLNKKNNSYLLLEYLALNPNKLFSIQELSSQLNKPREGASHFDDERRIRDTIQTIKKLLNLSEEDNFIIVDKKMFGIKCIVEIKG